MNLAEGNGIALYEAFRKYGIENFEFSILEECSEEQLNDKEKFYIQKYNSYNNGYNETLGGEGSTLYNYKDILKLWEDGFNVTEISKIIGSSKGTIERALNSYNIYNRRSRIYKPVDQYSLNKQYIKTFDSIYLASKQTNTDYSHISACCNKKIKSAGGFLWAFKGESPNTYIPRDYTKNTQCLEVNQYTLSGELIATYKSIGEAARKTKSDSSTISKCCRGKLKTTKGYKWSYANRIKEG